MPNLHGALFAIRAVAANPRRIVPAIRVDTIAQLDFAALKKAGYTGVVFDRDNCLDAWAKCKSTFGPTNVLIVSNSAGTRDDPLGIQAESLSFHLGVPVLRHSKKKPACVDEIETYFRRLSAPQPPVSSSPASDPRNNPERLDLNEPLDPDLIASASPVPPPRTFPHVTAPTPPRLLVIGDRLMTDVLLASCLGSQHLGIWTTRLWSRPDMPFVRTFEQSLLRTVLWFRNQTFRRGVVQARARGEDWLGREGWMWWIRRKLLSVTRRAPIPPEPIPPSPSEFARFVLPIPAKVALPPPLPTTRTGWAWYYAKTGGRYTAKGLWIALAWLANIVGKGSKRAWSWIVIRVKESRGGRVENSSHVKSQS